VRGYPAIVKLLNKYVEGTPVEKEFEPIAAVPVLRKRANLRRVLHISAK
jgi:hypothetical protein